MTIKRHFSIFVKLLFAFTAFLLSMILCPWLKRAFAGEMKFFILLAIVGFLVALVGDRHPKGTKTL